MNRPPEGGPRKGRLSVSSMLVIAGLAALLAWLAQRPGGTGPAGTAPNFDFYVLSLSWSPTYCAEAEGGGGEQCSGGRPFAFVLHGLWPQNERGWPQDCETAFGTRIDRRIAEDMLDIMPSRDLVFHEWRKHGTCSGLSPEAYFALARKAHDAVSVPAEFARLAGYKPVSPRAVEQAFIAANAGLQANEIAVTCSKRHLREVRICLGRDLTFRPCAEVDADACRATTTLMPPVRG